MGDFNYPNVDWQLLQGDRSSEEFLDLVQDCFLFQHVKGPTRENNILDLIFSTEENALSDVIIR